MNLEIKYLTPYLPYGLQFIGKFKNCISFDKNIKTLCHVDLDGRFEIIKPILIPRSDLLLPKWKYLENFDSKESQFEIYDLALISDGDLEWHLSYMSYGIVCFLIKNHFDIFGLIKKDLAISIYDVAK